MQDNLRDTMNKPEDAEFRDLEKALAELRKSPLLRSYFESIESQPYEEYKARMDSINARLDRLEATMREREDKKSKESKK